MFYDTIMLSQKDLQEIAKIVDLRVAPLEKSMQGMSSDMGAMQSYMVSMQKDIKTIKKKVSKNEKSLDVLIVRSDREETQLNKRVHKIEKHLGLTSH